MKKSSVGKIISISDLNIKILLSSNDVEIKDILYYEDEEKNLHRFEIVEMDSNIALAIPFESVNGVKKRNRFISFRWRFANRIFK